MNNDTALAAPKKSGKSSPKSTAESSLKIQLEPASAKRLARLAGQFNQHFQQIEHRLGIEIRCRGSVFSIIGETAMIKAAARLLENLYALTANGELSPDEIHLALQESSVKNLMTEAIANPSKRSGEAKLDDAGSSPDITLIRTKKCTVKPRGDNQQLYVRSVQTHDINFGIGPAGTGKTYLAVACAVEALLKDEVERILLVRPAVEAGEKLGFLPGDLSQKVDPYLRPLYDALYEMLGFETVDKLIERKVIEIAPLAYMRGRTLSNSFVILDESQNTTREQMKMFLTRIGFGSTAVINGDPSQIDLPRGVASGLRHAIDVLDGVEGISFTYFISKDVVRHPLVQRIVDAYDGFEQSQSDTGRSER